MRAIQRIQNGEVEPRVITEEITPSMVAALRALQAE